MFPGGEVAASAAAPVLARLALLGPPQMPSGPQGSHLRGHAERGLLLLVRVLLLLVLPSGLPFLLVVPYPWHLAALPVAHQPEPGLPSVPGSQAHPISP